MSDLIRRISQLPVNRADLVKWVLVKDAEVKARIKAIGVLKKLEPGTAAYRAALSDTQNIAEVLLYAEARLGELLEDLPSPSGSKIGKKGVSKTLPKNVSHKDSHYAQKLSRNREVIAETVAKARESGTVPLRRHVLHEIDAKKAHVSYNSGENEWYTPLVYIEAARVVMGVIDCDPASSDKANETIVAGVYYTRQTDGLSKPWKGNIWMNPPYSQPLIGQFCDKLVSEFESGNTEQACVLINNATETKYGQKLLRLCNAVCFPSSRIRFAGPQGDLGSPLQGQMILYFSHDALRMAVFGAEFEPLGVVLKGWCE